MFYDEKLLEEIEEQEAKNKIPFIEEDELELNEGFHYSTYMYHED